MSDHYEHEILLEEPGSVADRRPLGMSGIVMGLVLTGLVLFGLVVGGRTAASWLSGLGGFGEPSIEAVRLAPGQEVTIEIPSGASARQIAGLLVESGVVASSANFEREVRDQAVSNQLKAGGYEVVSGMDVGALVELLIAGPNLETFRVTLIEGRRIGEVMDDLARQSAFERDDFIDALVSGAVESIYLPSDVEGIQAWEGLLFPDTYEFFADTTPPEMLQRLSNEMERRISNLDWSYTRESGYTLYEAIVMASMVEAEAGVDEDRPLIASVLRNRLEIPMMLQIDATVLYALGQRRTGLTLDDLEVDSSYNTYVTNGLPPTPIGAPGFASLSAVANPSDSAYIFYVLSSLDGSHTFTETYEEFLVAKEQARADGILP